MKLKFFCILSPAISTVLLNFCSLLVILDFKSLTASYAKQSLVCVLILLWYWAVLTFIFASFLQEEKRVSYLFLLTNVILKQFNFFLIEGNVVKRTILFSVINSFVYSHNWLFSFDLDMLILSGGENALFTF